MNALEISDINLSKCKSMEDLVGKSGLMQRLFGNIIQQFLEAEMEEHLGREKYEKIDGSDKNYIISIIIAFIYFSIKQVERMLLTMNRVKTEQIIEN